MSVDKKKRVVVYGEKKNDIFNFFIIGCFLAVFAGLFTWFYFDVIDPYVNGNVDVSVGVVELSEQSGACGVLDDNSSVVRDVLTNYRSGLPVGSYVTINGVVRSGSSEWQCWLPVRFCNSLNRFDGKVKVCAEYELELDMRGYVMKNGTLFKEV